MNYFTVIGMSLYTLGSDYGQMSSGVTISKTTQLFDNLVMRTLTQLLVFIRKTDTSNIKHSRPYAENKDNQCCIWQYL